MSNGLLENSINVLEKIKEAKVSVESLGEEMEIIKKEVAEKEREEVQLVKKKYRDRLNKSTKSLKSKIDGLSKSLDAFEKEREAMIGKLMIKERKNTLSDIEKEALELLLQ